MVVACLLPQRLVRPVAVVVMDRRLNLGAPEANATWIFELSGWRPKVAELKCVDVHWQPQPLDVAVEVHSRQHRCTFARSLGSLYLHVPLPLQLDWPVPPSWIAMLGTALFASCRVHEVGVC